MRSGDRFRDRDEAGRVLADALAAGPLGEATDVQLLALPRGGVPVAAPVTDRFGWPLDVLVVRKVGAPGHRELAIGAVSEGGGDVRDEALCRQVDVDDERYARLLKDEEEELRRRVDVYRQGRPLPPLEGRDVVLVDDGLATGSTAAAGLRDLRAHRPRSLTLAVPVGAPESVARLEPEADAVVCPRQPHPFYAVGEWYQRFDQTTDAEVLTLLGRPSPP